MSGASFPSKILLFGEYTIIHQSLALAMPYPVFTGKLIADDLSCVDGEQSHQTLVRLFRHLKHTLSQTNDLPEFNLDSFEHDLSSKLFFQSSIPVGYGLGSSGALTAALYHRYVAKDGHLMHQRRDLAFLESFFHGVSSGIDPLVSYCNRSLLISSHSIHFMDLDGAFNGAFLINTQHPRSTEQLVKLFLQKCNSTEYLNVIKNELIPVTERCIGSFTACETNLFFGDLKKLSQLQYQCFPEAIPSIYKDLWQYGISSDNFYLKLCGSGGGGYILGFARDRHLAMDLIAKQGFVVNAV